jgi:hypothetical protein
MNRITDFCSGAKRLMSPCGRHQTQRPCAHAAGTRSFVIFMVNESDSSAKDDVSIEKYVSDRLGSGSKAIEWACFAFDEEKLYSLDEGLNKARALQLSSCTTDLLA